MFTLVSVCFLFTFLIPFQELHHEVAIWIRTCKLFGRGVPFLNVICCSRFIRPKPERWIGQLPLTPKMILIITVATSQRQMYQTSCTWRHMTRSVKASALLAWWRRNAADMYLVESSSQACLTGLFTSYTASLSSSFAAVIITMATRGHRQIKMSRKKLFSQSTCM